MSKSSKLPSIRKEAFTQAREALGLSTKELSGMACLSVRQIEQIENGETSTFYGDQVKVTAAKKVAGLLKLDLNDAFDYGEVTPAPKVMVEEEVKQVEEIAPVVKTKPKTEKAKPREVQKVELQAERNTITDIQQSIFSADNQKSVSHIHPQRKFFIGLAIVAALVFSVVNLRPLFFPEPVKEEIVLVQETVQENAPANPPTEVAADPKSTPTNVPAEASAPVAAASTECPTADPTALSYKPDAPKKPGDMVYLQSKTAQTVCVIDASGKTQSKTLEPGVGASIFGKPPFKVLTAGLAQVDLFYQGAKVRPASSAAKTIILEPTELGQPPAPTDSQLR